jgi:hypothetical protein
LREAGLAWINDQGGLVLAKSKMLAPAMVVAALVAAAPAQAGQSSTVPVCNQAENSFRGDYNLGSSSDPTPPAFNRGLQMEIGSGAGVVRAAQVSPALAVCESAPPPRPS